MLEARIIGTASSPASLLQERARHRDSIGTQRFDFPPSSSSSTDELKRTTITTPEGLDEEIAWYESTVVWSKGVQVHRRWTFDTRGSSEAVLWAGFVYFPGHGGSTMLGDSTPKSSTSSPGNDHNSARGDTFGPFHAVRQQATWSRPTTASSSTSASSSTMPSGPSSSSTSTGVVRTIMVCLKARAMVYYPSGDHHAVHLPFPVSSAFPLPPDVGGVMLQRQLDASDAGRRHQGHGGSMLRGIKSIHHSILDDIDTLDDLGDGGDTRPRLYTLRSPFEELKPVVEAQVDRQVVIGDVDPIDGSSEALFSGTDYPFVVAFDRSTGEIIFYVRHHIPIVETPIASTSHHHLRPHELLAEHPVPGQASGPSSTVNALPVGSRPSLHRTASAVSKTDRRGSNMPSVPGEVLDRSRRGPRVSRGGVVEPQHAPSAYGATFTASRTTNTTEELQAALDPPTLPSPGSNLNAPPPTGPRIKLKGRARPSLTGERYQSGMSGFGASFTAEDGGTERNVLFGAKEVDLRETTMMMGLNKVEEGRSEVVLQRIWVWKLPRRSKSSELRVFVSENLSRDIVSINVHCSDTLFVFPARFTGEWRIAPPTTIRCVAAEPVISTRHNIFDTAILHEGRIHIVSANQAIPTTIPSGQSEGRDELPRQLASSLNMTLEPDDPMGEQSSRGRVRDLLAIKDAAHTRMTVTFEDGETARVDVDHRIQDPLVKQCFEAIVSFLAPETAFVLKRELALGMQNLATSSKLNSNRAWDVFVDVLRSVLGYGRSNQADQETDRRLLSEAGQSTDTVTQRLAHRLRARAGRPPESVRSSMTQGPDQDPTVPASVLLALHLVGQDCRLSQTRKQDLRLVAGLVMELCDLIDRKDWKDYWTRLVPGRASSDRLSTAGGHDTSILDQYEQPPDILSYLGRRLLTPLKPFPSPQNINSHMSELGVTHPCPATSLITSIYDHLGVSSDPSTDPKERLFSLQARAGEMVRFMAERGLTHDYISDLPAAIAMPILEMIRVAQIMPKKSWSIEMFVLIGRTDLAAQAGSSLAASRQGAVQDVSNLQSWEGLNSHKQDEGPVPTVGSIINGMGESTSKSTDAASKSFVRFGADKREQEVERIMQTTHVRTILVQPPKNASDADIASYQQSMVNTIANRTLSILVGQGIFEYGTRPTDITDAFEIPLIELTVKVVPGKQTLQAQIAAENADWPCFHNGVSAALSISPDCKGIDSSWIVYNRPQTLNPEHGGFLLGLGLTGHLRSLATYHAFPYMEPRHDFTSVGLLLGLAASFAGSEDLLLTKVLSLHTHALLPLGSMELNASAIIQSTALVGLGLVYVGSRNLRMAEVALEEVGRKEMPGVEGFKDNVEAYSFSASMAFGLIMLGRGGQTTSEVDRRLLMKLTSCIVGAPPSVEQFGTAAPTASAIDTTITAPGATLALGFMYLKTNRQDVADILEIPTSAFALEHVRPDILLLRTLARGLIMWEQVSASMKWVDSQIPDFMDHKNHKKPSQMELQTELGYMNILAGACLTIGLKYAGTAGETAHNSLMTCYNVLSKAAMGTSTTYEGRIRRTAARQALNVVTIAWTVVMSGTGELNVLRRLRFSHGTEGLGVNYGTHMAMHMALGILFCGRGYYTLGSSNLAIAAMAISFFPRFSTAPGENKAYPQAFRHLWALAVEPRCLVAKDVDTRETVYLPVKIKLNEQDQMRTQQLISPTLIAPFEQIASIEVDSPRYWPITYDLSNPRDRSALVKTRTIWVKRKAGYLNYNKDAKGHRSIFVRAGAMTGYDLHYDLISPAAPPTITPDEVMELVKAHSGHPALVSMAGRFTGETVLEKAVRIVLLECVSLDKTAMIPIYLSLLLCLRSSSLDDGEDEHTVEVVRQLGFLRTFYASSGLYERFYSVSTGRDRPSALIRINFVLTLYRRLTEGEADEAGVRRYFRDGVWEVEGYDAKRHLAVYLAKNHVPPLPLLQALANRVSGGESRRDETLELRVRDVARAYERGLAGQWDLYPIERRREGEKDAMVMWKAESVDDALEAWTA